MAFRLGLGKVFGFLRPRWGVRGSLFAAFAVIAAMAIVISAGAGFVLRHLGTTMVDLSGRDIPRLSASLQLSAQAASLAAQGPALLAAQSDDALNERAKKMKELQAQTQQKLGEVIELGADKTVVSALNETIKNINEAAQSLASAARERLDVAALHDKQYDALRAAQAAFTAAASPAMLDAQTQVNAILGSANLSASDANDAAQTLGQLGNVVASGNLVAADMSAALSANSSDKLDDIEKEFKQAQGRLRSNLDLLPENAGTKALREVRRQAAGARHGQDRRIPRAPKGARCRRLRPDRPRRNPQAQCRPRHQRAAAGRGRAEGNQRHDLPDPARDLLCDHGHAGAGRRDPARLGAVRLALCRRQHPAPHQGPAALDAALVQWRSRDRYLPLQAEGRNRGDVGHASGVPRQHDQGPRALRRPGQGPRRQSRTHLAHGSPNHRVRGHRARRARQSAAIGQFDADDRAEHVLDRGPVATRW